MLAYRKDEVLGKPFSGFIHPLDRARAIRFYARQSKDRTPATYFELRCVASDGQIHWLGENVQLLFDDKGQMASSHAIARDITKRKEAEQALARQAAQDSLTGLANRTRFKERVSRCIQQSHREPDYIFGVLFLDLDRFKVIK